ncbi:uncharacterized protein BXIN_2293 [Babesia sp. Xinjiang]|uniref:uncharacterized protein n=1 Tax=Babesia sp. Xinjiang TaxID=462227 RepID=UPI000A2549FC|nr:uncharacterized protein BXIN_2293 [Babesia sp. Xinjiang]ORM40685.1 hypothetical protein BXIN_2293 [Babesia sp. Xinjiang]
MAGKRSKACLLLLAIYMGFWIHVYRQPWTGPAIIFLLMPFVLLVALMLYAAFCLIHAVVTFNRSDTALDDLKEDIKVAAGALQRAGFDFDKFGVVKP